MASRQTDQNSCSMFVYQASLGDGQQHQTTVMKLRCVKEQASDVMLSKDVSNFSKREALCGGEEEGGE